MALVTTGASTREERRLEWPDFLRGAAALAIVLFHVRVTMWVGLRALSLGEGYSWIDRAFAWVTLPFPLFGSAVMLFFVVSGFAIHYPYAKQNVDFSGRAYAVRRFFRIYPPYLAAVLLTVISERVAAFAAPQPVSSWPKIAASAVMLQNYVPPAGQMAGNPSLWSLPVEVELYLVYPLLLWAWRRIGTTRMFAGVAMASAAAAAFLLLGHEWPTGNFLKYWVIWVSGAVLAEWARTNAVPIWRRWHGYLAVAFLVAAVGARATGVLFGFGHFIWGALYFLLMLWGLNRPAALDRVPPLVRRGMLRLGEMSYSLYLLHYPLLVILGAWWVAASGGKPVSVLIPLLASVAILPFAYLLWRFVERPSRVHGRALAAAAGASG